MIKTLDFKKLLKEQNILLLEDWNVFSFKHQKPASEAEKTRQIEYLKNELGLDKGSNPKGLYAYKRGDELLYIGKGSPIFNRLKSHYRESYEPVPGDTKDRRWHKFFSTHTGDITIYWISVEDETSRKILELALHSHFKPSFESLRLKK